MTDKAAGRVPPRAQSPARVIDGPCRLDRFIYTPGISCI